MVDINSLELGSTASFSKTIEESDIDLYGQITGDMNPVHMDSDYAKETIFGERIAHGMLSAGLISAAIAMKLAGPGTVYKEQMLSFIAPVRIGDRVTATVEIIELGKKKKSAKLKTTCVNQNGQLILEGHAFVLLPRRKRQ